MTSNKLLTVLNTFICELAGENKPI